MDVSGSEEHMITDGLFETARVETEWSKRQVIDELQDQVDTMPALASDNPIDIFSKATVLQLQFRRLGISRKVKTDAIDVKKTASDTDTDKALVSVTKKILDSPELAAIARHDSETARWVDSKKAGPAFANQGGFHLVPLVLKPEIDRYLDAREAERADLVDAFLEVYSLRIEETRARLGSLKWDVQYPERSEAAAAFGMTRSFMTFGYTDPAAAAQWQAEALQECRATLRLGFAEVISRLAERLTPDESGKPKVFRDSLVKNFEEFAEALSKRNLANDTELAALVQEGRRIMSGVDAGDLRNRGSLRRRVAESVAQIDKAAAALVTNRPSRAYGLE
jgi:hypothetical protein